MDGRVPPCGRGASRIAAWAGPCSRYFWTIGPPREWPTHHRRFDEPGRRLAHVLDVVVDDAVPDASWGPVVAAELDRLDLVTVAGQPFGQAVPAPGPCQAPCTSKMPAMLATPPSPRTASSVICCARLG